MSEIFAGRKFLVVDDEPDLREILRDELEFAGAELSEAENGQQAFAMIEAEHFDAIISDIRMPGGDGMTLAKKVKSKTGHIPVMFLVTGFADFTPVEAYEIGVEGFIYKPFSLAPVIDSLARVLTEESSRWSAPEAVIENLQEVRLEGTLEDGIKNGKIKVGRGGVFVTGSFTDLHRDEPVRVNFAGGASVTGVLRWHQPDDKGHALQAGMGVEILHLSDPAMKVILPWISAHHPQSYIPRS